MKRVIKLYPYFLIPLFLLSTEALAKATPAQILHGTVSEMKEGKKSPLPGANVVWVNTTKGTVTDKDGIFTLDMSDIVDKRIVVSFVGFRNDTTDVSKLNHVDVVLTENVELKEVEVTERVESNYISKIDPLKREIITDRELKKAACCNLGESFETNASVDVTYKDALSGSKEIQVLGLSGSYIQLLTENMPLINGLGLTYGLNYIPGTQIDAINIVKGPGSVVFGHESVSGMVNVDLKDPSKAEKIFVNGFVDQNLRKELNVDKGFKMKNGWSTLLSIHADHSDLEKDANGDRFMDMPILTSFNALSKWKYTGNRGLMSQNSFKYLYEDRMGGQTGAKNTSANHADSSNYSQQLVTNRMEFYGRTGYIIPASKYNSIGFQYAAVSHRQEGYYGFKNYSGMQQHVSLRLLWNVQPNEYNSLNSGISYSYREISEEFDEIVYNKKEIVPGIFLENTFKKSRIPALITGLRADYFDGKIYLTPRGNVKYSINENTDIRISAGTAFKTADILAENPAILASARKIFVNEKLQPEKAVNIGANLTHSFRLAYRKGSAGLDLYKTIFTNKIIPDFDSDPSKVIFSNLRGEAYSNNMQAELSYEVLKKIELKIAYKYLDVYSMTNGTRITQPFIAKHRILGTVHYETFDEKWKFNITHQWYGKKKLPATINNPVEYRRPLWSDPYSTVNVQVTRIFNRFEVYIGAENLFAFTQKDPILGAGDPYGSYFDTSFIWGPLDGRKIYGGFRYKITDRTKN